MVPRSVETSRRNSSLAGAYKYSSTTNSELGPKLSMVLSPKVSPKEPYGPVRTRNPLCNGMPTSIFEALPSTTTSACGATVLTNPTKVFWAYADAANSPSMMAKAPP